MKVYVFGNKDVSEDSVAFKVADTLKGKIAGIEFIIVSPNEDLPFVDEKNIVLFDGVEGLRKVTVIDEQSLDKLVAIRSTTVHDYDLGFQLKYLKKLGKIEKITIIGLPQTGEVDYDFIQSILRKLVLHDMQGS